MDVLSPLLYRSFYFVNNHLRQGNVKQRKELMFYVANRGLAWRDNTAMDGLIAHG